MTWQTALRSNRLLSPESYTRMTTPGTLTDGTPLTYGYGLSINNLDGRLKIWHGGGINGFRTQLSYYPDDDLTVVVPANTGAASPEVLESTIARLVLGIPEVVVEEVAIEEVDLWTYAGTYDPGRSPMRLGVPDGALYAGSRRLRYIGNHTFLPPHDNYSRWTFTVVDGTSVQLRLE